MKRAVLDASVLLKWVFAGSDTKECDNALAIRAAVMKGELDVLLPSLWFFEVGNVLHRLAPARAEDILKSFVEFGFEAAPMEDRWVRRACQLVRDYAVTFYDASYHALALAVRGEFITADLKYFNKARRAGSVIPLRDWRG